MLLGEGTPGYGDAELPSENSHGNTLLSGANNYDNTLLSGASNYGNTSLSGANYLGYTTLSGASNHGNPQFPGKLNQQQLSEETLMSLSWFVRHHSSVNISIEQHEINHQEDGLVKLLFDQIEFLKEELRERNMHIRMLLSRNEQ